MQDNSRCTDDWMLQWISGPECPPREFWESVSKILPLNYPEGQKNWGPYPSVPHLSLVENYSYLVLSTSSQYPRTIFAILGTG